MAYTVPPTFVASDPLAAADLNILGDDLIDHEARISAQSFSGVRLLTSGASSVPDSVFTDVSWDSATFDQGGWWASGATITVPAGTVPAGYTDAVLSVAATVRFDVNGTGNRQLKVIKNGSAWSYNDVRTADASETTTCLVVEPALIATDGDTIKVQCWQSSGGALDCTTQHLAISRVGLIV